jgi:glycosyltransferase involved in cell wall biosynthesis
MTTKRIILAQFNTAEGYPPVLNQASILAEHAEVTLLDTGSENERKIEIPGVERQRVNWEKGGKLQKFSRLKARLNFAKQLSSLVKQTPDAVIAFEPDAIALMMANSLSRECVRIGHLHEHPSPGAYASAPIDRMALRYVSRHASELDLLVVADGNRGALLQERWNLKKAPLVVKNCPRKMTSLPSSRLNTRLPAQGLENEYTVYYHGVIGLDQGVHDIVASMTSWPVGSQFVMAGVVSDSFRDSLYDIAGNIGIPGRLVFLGYIPRDQLLSYAVGAHVATSLYDPTHEGNLFSAGSSNKRFEYAALGLPQVTNEGPLINELFVSKGIALAVPFGNREAIGQAIAHLLTSPSARHQMGTQARAAHLGEYNYEREFEPLMAMIIDGRVK